MSAVFWSSTTKGNWNDGKNWSGGAVPGAADDVTVTTPSHIGIIYKSGSDTIHSLVFGGNDTLAFSGGTLSVLTTTNFSGALMQSGGVFSVAGGDISGLVKQTKGTLAVSSGTLTLEGTGNIFKSSITGGALNFNAGSDTLGTGAVLGVANVELTAAALTIGENLTYSGSFSQTGGTLALGADTLTLSGTAALDSYVSGAGGALLLTGQTAIGNSFVADANLAIVNTGTISQSGTMIFGEASGSAVMLSNAVGGVFQLSTSSELQGFSGAGTINNAGTILVAGSSGEASIAVNLVSTGTLSVGAGGVRLSVGNDSLGGTVNGAGSLELNGGTVDFQAGLSLSTGTLQLDGADVRLDGALNYTGLFIQTSGALALNGNALTVGGISAFTGGLAYGAGSISISGNSQISDFVVSGSATLVNTGMLTQYGSWYLGYDATDTASFQNVAGGMFTIDDTGTIFGVAGSSISNAGTILMNGAGNTGTIDPAFANIGTVDLGAGSLYFAGPVIGNGEFSLGNSTSLTFAGSVAPGGAVFLGASDNLSVNTTAGFDDAINGFALSDVIDLTTLQYGASNSLSFNATTDVLTVSNGSATGTLQFVGTYTKSNFHLINDHGSIGITHT